MTQIILDSRYRNSGDIQKCTFELSNHLQDVSKLCVLSVNIPNSIHVFNTNNYTISFNEGAGTLTGNLPIGSYDEIQLAVYLKNLLDTAGALTYTVSFISNTNTFDITSTGPWNLLCSSNNFPFRELGFNSTDIASSGVTNIISSIKSINLASPQYLTIDFPNLPIKNLIRGGSGIGGKFAIPISSDSFSFNNVTSGSTYEICFSQKIITLTHINVEIIIPYGIYELLNDWVIILLAS